MAWTKGQLSAFTSRLCILLAAILLGYLFSTEGIEPRWRPSRASLQLHSRQLAVPAEDAALVSPAAGRDASASQAVSPVTPLQIRQADDPYTCGPGRPCSNGACCGPTGNCGYAPAYCGAGCTSNCNAKAQCGQYAENPGQTCQLNACCSEHGFCGTTRV